MKHPGEYYAKKGYSFFAYDRRGHGVCDEKDTGYVRDFSYFIKDNIEFVKFLKKEENPDEVIMIGHSNGGGIALATVLYDNTIVDRMVLFESQLKRDGAAHIPLFTVNFDE